MSELPRLPPDFMKSFIEAMHNGLMDMDPEAMSQMQGTPEEALRSPLTNETWIVHMPSSIINPLEGMHEWAVYCCLVADYDADTETNSIVIASLMMHMDARMPMTTDIETDSLFKVIVTGCNKPGFPGPSAMLKRKPSRPCRVLFTSKGMERALRERLNKELGIKSTGVARDSLANSMRAFVMGQQVILSLSALFLISVLCVTTSFN
jgi:hypothetical protein